MFIKRSEQMSVNKKVYSTSFCNFCIVGIRTRKTQTTKKNTE